MKASSLELERKKNHVIKQLEKYGYKDNEHYTYRELVNKLAVARALEIKAESPHNTWF